MEDLIKEFLSVDSGYCDGDGYGYGYGSGYGDGDGDGDGDVYGYGSGYCDGDGDGYGSGYGDGDGDGYGYGDGVGVDSGSGYGDGDGYGYGYGDGLSKYDGRKVYMVDSTQTIFDSVHGDFAKGFILQSDLTLTPCYVAKGNNKFAHGATLHEAVEALNEKLYDDSTEEERIEVFNGRFSDRTVKYPAKELFHWHHVLTGSCKAGRLAFCKDKGIDIESDTFTVNEFIELTKDSYGGDTIRKL